MSRIYSTYIKRYIQLMNFPMIFIRYEIVENIDFFTNLESDFFSVTYYATHPQLPLLQYTLSVTLTPTHTLSITLTTTHSHSLQNTHLPSASRHWPGLTVPQVLKVTTPPLTRVPHLANTHLGREGEER